MSCICFFYCYTDQMEADLAIKGKPITRKGKTYFNVDTFNVNIRPKSATFRFANILNSNAALSKSSVNCDFNKFSFLKFLIIN